MSCYLHSRWIVRFVAVTLCVLSPAFSSTAHAQDSFLVGDADANGRVDLLADVHHMLDFGSTPNCVAAADVDENGTYFVLLDSLALINALVADGPAAVGECREVDESPLSCAISFDGCPDEPLDLGPDDPDRTLTISSTEGGVVSTATVTIELQNDGSSIDGFQFSICHDEGLAIDASDIVRSSDLEDVDSPIIDALEVLDDGFGVVFLANPILLQTLGTGTIELYSATYSLPNSIGTYEVIACTRTVGELETVPMVIDSGTPDAPTVENGAITVFDPLFVRGDADNDGAFFGILDALYLLEWGFVDGPAPECRDAADADDDGVLFPIVDAIAILEAAFFGATLPTPGLVACGPDPTEDALDCADPSPLACLE